MSSQMDVSSEYAREEFEVYRALSRPAVISVLLAVLSLAALLFPVLLVLPALAVVCGLIALRSIRRYPRELSGRFPASIGVLLGSVLLVGGASLHTYVYLTEVPDGYQRISFAELQPAKEHPQLPVPPEAIDLDGEQVFVKGYVYPDGQQSGIRQFVLVPDMGTCCFGGQPKLTDMIQVTLKEPHRIEYNRRKRKLAGVLKVDTRLKPVSGLQGVYYQLEADYVK